MLKISNFTVTELKNYYFNDEVMFFTKNAVQQLFFSQAQNQFYFQKIQNVDNFCPKGRFHVYTAKDAAKYL